MCPALAWKVLEGQCFFDTILDLPCSCIQFHLKLFLSTDLLSCGRFLTFPSLDRFKHH